MTSRVGGSVLLAMRSKVAKYMLVHAKMWWMDWHGLSKDLGRWKSRDVLYTSSSCGVDGGRGLIKKSKIKENDGGKTDQSNALLAFAGLFFSVFKVLSSHFCSHCYHWFFCIRALYCVVSPLLSGGVVLSLWVCMISCGK